jgi:hypothetical protein
MSGLALVRNPASHQPAAEQDQWIFPGACLSAAILAVQPLEAEDEFERARR